MSNYIQYVNSNGVVNTKEVELSVGFYDNYFSLVGIKESFFILSLFHNNKKVDGVSFGDSENIEMLSYINSDTVDLDLLNPNSYFNSETEVTLVTKKLTASAVQQVQVTNLPEAVPNVYLHKYKTPFVQDTKQIDTTFNPFALAFDFTVSSYRSRTSGYITNRETWSNTRGSKYSNYNAIDPLPWYRETAVPFNTFFRWMDLYIKIEIDWNNFSDGTQGNGTGSISLRLDLRTNEMIAKYFNSNFSDYERDNGGRGVYTQQIKTIVGGQRLDLDSFTITIMNEPTV